MNLNFGRRDRLNQEMASSLPASLFLLSVVFWQFVSAAGQNNVTLKAEPGENVILPCKDPDQGQVKLAEWSRTDLESEFVLLYRDSQFDPINQHPSYWDRVDLLVGQIKKGDVSLVLQNTTTADSGTYECEVAKTDRERKLISSISLDVAPPPPPGLYSLTSGGAGDIAGKWEGDLDTVNMEDDWQEAINVVNSTFICNMLRET